MRVLSVVDAYTRECVALEADPSLASRRVTGVLEGAMRERGGPQPIRCDNGPELTSRHFLAWCLDQKIELAHIQPGRPTQNGKVESFHGRLRDEFLNATWFANLFQARRKIAAWKREYNEERPHSSLAYRTPSEFAREVTWPSRWGIAAPGRACQGNPAGSLRSARTDPPTPRLEILQEGEWTN